MTNEKPGGHGERSVFAHGVHLCDEECACLAETGSAVAFCPTSNLFLGIGLFNLPMAEKHKLNVGLGPMAARPAGFMPEKLASRVSGFCGMEYCPASRRGSPQHAGPGP